MKIKTGEIIKLSNDKEYICFSTLSHGGVDYVYLMSNFKPLEIKFGIEHNDGEKIMIKLVNDNVEKQKILELFKEHNKLN